VTAPARPAYIRHVLDKVNLHSSAAELPDQWVPQTVGSYNGDHVQVIRVQGEFVWHHHDRTDDLFICLSGRAIVQLRDGNVELDPGDMVVVPVGVEHCVFAPEEAHLLVLEHLGDDAADLSATEMSGPIFGL
jgi:mannose-6-phosphate isomerase-like protein (cupin superfamily)